MSLRRTLAIARKELRHIVRDPRLLFLVTIAPTLLALTFSYVFSFDVQQAALAVLDLDRSALSRQLLSHLTADGDFWVHSYVSSFAEIDELLLRGAVEAALVIPPGFDRDIRRGRPVGAQSLAPLLLIVEGMDTIEARQNAGYLEARVAAFAAAVPAPDSSQSPAPRLEVRSRAWYNPTLKSLLSMVPALVAVVLQMPALALALALSREKESGSFESLITTPVRGVEYLLGKLSAYIASGLFSAFLTLAVAVFWFHVPFRGNLGLFFLLSTVFFLASMGLGLLVGNFVSSQQTAMVIMMLVIFIPSFFLSGLLLPVDRTSPWAQISGLSLPATHFIHICRSLFLKGVGLAELWPSATWLAVMGIGLLVFNILLFRKRA
ncbi:MAG: ABC transporter permease [Anaerolineae bacterium]|nr:ABC transporter permease [Anaerolineae bacterium]